MRIGIMNCDLNGVGKSMLGKALSERLHFYFIDSEKLYFPKTDTNDKYTSFPTHKETQEPFLAK